MTIVTVHTDSAQKFILITQTVELGGWELSTAMPDLHSPALSNELQDAPYCTAKPNIY